VCNLSSIFLFMLFSNFPLKILDEYNNNSTRIRKVLHRSEKDLRCIAIPILPIAPIASSIKIGRAVYNSTYIFFYMLFSNFLLKTVDEYNGNSTRIRKALHRSEKNLRYIALPILSIAPIASSIKKGWTVCNSTNIFFYMLVSNFPLKKKDFLLGNFSLRFMLQNSRICFSFGNDLSLLG
jgi:hypothetical protein